jgi:hypothetical protein
MLGPRKLDPPDLAVEKPPPTGFRVIRPAKIPLANSRKIEGQVLGIMRFAHGARGNGKWLGGLYAGGGDSGRILSIYDCLKSLRPESIRRVEARLIAGVNPHLAW